MGTHPLQRALELTVHLGLQDRLHQGLRLRAQQGGSESVSGKAFLRHLELADGKEAIRGAAPGPPAPSREETSWLLSGVRAALLVGVTADRDTGWPGWAQDHVLVLHCQEAA